MSCSYIGDWICMGGCAVAPSGDARTGSLSMHVYNRFDVFSVISDKQFIFLFVSFTRKCMVIKYIVLQIHYIL